MLNSLGDVLPWVPPKTSIQQFENKSYWEELSGSTDSESKANEEYVTEWTADDCQSSLKTLTNVWNISQNCHNKE